MENTRLKLSPVLADIAQRYFGTPTLEARNSGSLDFLDVSGGTLRAALEEAFKAGRRSNEDGRFKMSHKLHCNLELTQHSY